MHTRALTDSTLPPYAHIYSNSYNTPCMLHALAVFRRREREGLSVITVAAAIAHELISLGLGEARGDGARPTSPTH